MAEKQISDDVRRQLEQAKQELIPEVLKTAGNVERATIDVWIERYTRKFTKAIVEDGRKYPDDRKKLIDAAHKLGRKARKLAGDAPVSGDNAKDASDQEDCKKKGTHLHDYWCA